MLPQVIPADLRLILVSNLSVSEQLLTGESIPVVKTTSTFDKSDKEVPLGDRTNLCYSSTIVTQGRGTGIVVATGMNAQIGRIADALQNKNTKGAKKVEQPSFFHKIKEAIIDWSYVCPLFCRVTPPDMFLVASGAVLPFNASSPSLPMSFLESLSCS